MAAEPQYFAPNTVEEAVEILNRCGDDAKVIAGGQSLMPLINLRVLRPGALVDITRIGSLRHISQQGATLCLGALARHREVAASDVVARAAPLLQAAAQHIGHRQIRARGTIGGSLAHADPSAEYPVACVALEARFRVAGAQGERWVPAQDFFLGPLSTRLLPTELLTEVQMPVQPPGTGWGFHEMALREGDFALVVAAALVRLDAEERRVTWMRLAVGGMDPVPVRCEAAEALLLGEEPAAARIQEAVRVALDGLHPEDDVRASAEYRRDVAGVLIRDAVADAVRRAQGIAIPRR